MKELSEELKNIAWEAFRSAPGRVPSVEAACLAVGNAMVEQDRKDAAGPELTEEEYDQIRARSHIKALCQYQGKADASIRREINAILSRRRSLSESQWAEVEKAIREVLNNRRGWWAGEVIDRFLADVRARLLPPKTPPTPEPEAEEPTIRALVMALALATEGDTRGTGAAAMYLRMAQEKLRGKREGGQ